MLGDNLLAQRGQEATSLLCYLDRDPAREASLTHPKPKRPWIAKCLPTPSCAFLSSCCRLLCSSLANSCQLVACSIPRILFFSFLFFIFLRQMDRTPCRLRLDIYFLGMEGKGKRIRAERQRETQTEGGRGVVGRMEQGRSCLLGRRDGKGRAPWVFNQFY